MIRQCVVLNGQVINIGEWDYQTEQVETKPAIIDEETQEAIEPAEYETVIRNPLPDGAEFVDIEVVVGADGGLYPADYTPPKTDKERIEELESENTMLQLALADLAEAQEADKTDMQLALVELASLLDGGA